MTTQLTSAQVCQALEKEIFAVVGMVNANQEARTVGIMYTVRDRKLYFSTATSAWKTRYITANAHVSVTVPIAKRIPVMPWIKIPAATITFAGTARVFPATEVTPDLLRAILGPLADDLHAREETSIVEVTPTGDFITYGVGVSLRDMRLPELARGRAAVA
ncbi:MAG: pyridoxamine 5'-phosphate oxidase family protein [Caldilineales bacterium]